MSSLPPVIAVVGPTAAGKTALAVALARRLQGEIINADSMQFYRGMDIGTAKATETERQGVVHHMMDHLAVTEETSAAEFQQRCRALIAEIRQRGRTPILVGGSGLYIRAALDIIEFPPTDPVVRDRLRHEMEEFGAKELRERLRQVDPESASTVTDERRLVRALEVVEITGRSFVSYMPQRQYLPSLEPVIQLGLNLPREELHQRIEQRVHQMHASGLLQEVRGLEKQGLRHGRTAARAIGYEQYLRVLDQEITSEQAIEGTVVATRRLARRQLTWFRADPRVEWFHAESPELVESALRHIQYRAADEETDADEKSG